MKNKLFLSLSVLTAALNAGAPIFKIAKPIFNTVSNHTVSKSLVPTAQTATTAAELTFKRVLPGLNAGKAAAYVATVSTVPFAIAYSTGNLVNNMFTSKPVAQPTRFERVKNAFSNAGTFTKNHAVNAGSFVKANVQAHPYISAGAGLATVAGLGYAAYNKGLFGKAKGFFGKAKTVAKQPAQQVVAQTKKAKRNNVRHVRSYGPRRA